MDADLDQMSRAELVVEARRLRDEIRKHRDASMHDLCWHHPTLWSLLPEGAESMPVVPAWPEFTNDDPKAMWLRNTAFVGRVPSEGSLKVLDEYFAWRRTPAGDAWAK